MCSQRLRSRKPRHRRAARHSNRACEKREVPALVTRTEWKAKPFNGLVRGLGNHTHVVVHHAAGYQADNLREGKKQLRAMQTLHQETNEWSDIGYHFVVDGAGNVYQGRPFMVEKPLGQAPELAMGAHVKNQNSGKIGVCLLGCFHPSEPNCSDLPRKEALASAISLIAFLCKSYMGCRWRVS